MKFEKIILTLIAIHLIYLIYIVLNKPGEQQPGPPFLNNQVEFKFYKMSDALPLYNTTISWDDGASITLANTTNRTLIEDSRLNNQSLTISKSGCKNIVIRFENNVNLLKSISFYLSMNASSGPNILRNNALLLKDKENLNISIDNNSESVKSILRSSYGSVFTKDIAYQENSDIRITYGSSSNFSFSLAGIQDSIKIEVVLDDALDKTNPPSSGEPNDDK